MADSDNSFVGRRLSLYLYTMSAPAEEYQELCSTVSWCQTNMLAVTVLSVIKCRFGNKFHDTRLVYACFWSVVLIFCYSVAKHFFSRSFSAFLCEINSYRLGAVTSLNCRYT